MLFSGPVLTEEQMEAAGIDPQFRDYCAHHFLEFLRCRQDHYPWVIACKAFHHQWQECLAEEYVVPALLCCCHFMYCVDMLNAVDRDA